MPEETKQTSKNHRGINFRKDVRGSEEFSKEELRNISQLKENKEVFDSSEDVNG